MNSFIWESYTLLIIHSQFMMWSVVFGTMACLGHGSSFSWADDLPGIIGCDSMTGEEFSNVDERFQIVVNTWNGLDDEGKYPHLFTPASENEDSIYNSLMDGAHTGVVTASITDERDSADVVEDGAGVPHFSMMDAGAFWSPLPKRDIAWLPQGAAPLNDTIRLLGLATFWRTPKIDLVCFIAVIREAFPDMSHTDGQSLFDEMLSVISIPIWLHDWLSDNVYMKPVSADDLNAIVQKLRAKSRKPLPSNIHQVVLDWMEYCVQPFRLITGFTTPPCVGAIIKGRDVAILSPAQASLRYRAAINHVSARIALAASVDPGAANTWATAD